jgi:hypothetical protein
MHVQCTIDAHERACVATGGIPLDESIASCSVGCSVLDVVITRCIVTCIVTCILSCSLPAHCLLQVVGSIVGSSSATPEAKARIDQGVSLLVHALSSCERILSTPIPLAYTR